VDSTIEVNKGRVPWCAHVTVVTHDVQHNESIWIPHHNDHTHQYTEIHGATRATKV
jgi:hypothetical protein